MTDIDFIEDESMTRDTILEMNTPLRVLKIIIQSRIEAREKLKTKKWDTVQGDFGNGTLATREFYSRLAWFLESNHWCYVRENFISGRALAKKLAFIAINKQTGNLALISCKSTMGDIETASYELDDYHKVLGISHAQKILAVPELPKSPASRTYQRERDALEQGREILSRSGVQLILIPRSLPKLDAWRSIEEFVLWYVSWHGPFINGYCFKCEYGRWRFKAATPYSVVKCPACQRKILGAVGTRKWSRDIRMHCKRCKRMKLTKSYVYLMKDAHGLHKIGCSKNPSSRLKQLSSKDNPITLLYKIERSGSPFRLERDLHWLFSSKRVKGEWFRLLDEDVAYIRFLAGERNTLDQTQENK